MNLIDCCVEAEAVGNRMIARIAQDRRASANEHRKIVDRKVKTIEHFLDAFVAIGVDRRVWMRVSREEFLDANRIRRMIRSDEHHISNPARKQSRSAQQKRADEDLAQLGVGLYE